MRELPEEIATRVGLLLFFSCQILCSNSRDSSHSQSITTKSLLDFLRASSAFEGRKQIWTEIESSWRMADTVLKSPESLETNKHSNAISDVIKNSLAVSVDAFLC